MSDRIIALSTDGKFTTRAMDSNRLIISYVSLDDEGNTVLNGYIEFDTNEYKDARSMVEGLISKQEELFKMLSERQSNDD